jgi:hypothetical protein
MSKNNLLLWINCVGVVGVMFGLFYAFFGLAGFPAYHELVPAEVLAHWSNGLYGAVFIGFSVLLLFVGRHAIEKEDKKLMKALLYGIFSWLFVEAAFSLYYSVFFNIGVDILLIIVLGLPLVKAIYASHKM